MIYDSDKIEDLIRQYKQGDEEVVGEVVEESRQLVEAIVTKYIQNEPHVREDFIQECLIKITKVMDYYDPDVASAYKYFASVIGNHCRDLINKHNEQQKLKQELKLDPSRFGYAKMPSSQKYLLTELKERNRERFPSITAARLDEVTEHVFHCIIDGVHGKSRGAIKELTEVYGMNRYTAMIVYHSSLAYFRHKYRKEVDPDFQDEPKEISLLPELKEILGEEAYKHVALVMSGMYVKFP